MLLVKQFLLFGFDKYYPEGGAEDFVADFDTLEEAEEFVKTHNPKRRDLYNIMDLATLSVVNEGEWKSDIWYDSE